MERLLTLQDVADLTNIPVETLQYHRYRGDGGPRAVKIGRALRFREEDVANWIEQCIERSPREVA